MSATANTLNFDFTGKVTGPDKKTQGSSGGKDVLVSPSWSMSRSGTGIYESTVGSSTSTTERKRRSDLPVGVNVVETSDSR